MSAKRVSAMAVALLFAVTSCACLISAEDEQVPVMITKPAGDEPISCAVFFADNMVYAPQWRVDNFVRIEIMVLNMTGLTSPHELLVSDTDLYVGDDAMFVDGLDQQAGILADSKGVLPLTRMVSVSYIEITITLGGETAEVLAAGWDPETGVKVIDQGLGHEVNQAGHLIYGTLWDTTGFDEGTYTTNVRLGYVEEVSEGVWEPVIGGWYEVDYAIGHIYNPEGEEGELLYPDNPYWSLAPTEEHLDYIAYKIGLGGLGTDLTGTDFAWCELGPLIGQGSGGGNGGGGNDGDGNGNGGDGDGNGNGGDGGNGNGNLGELSGGRKR